MMIKNILIEKFKKYTTGKDELGAKRIIDSDLISNFVTEYDEDILFVKSKILSDNFYNEYNSNLEIDVKTKEVLSTFCTCDDFERNEIRKNNYCCKHLYATMFKFIDSIEDNQRLLAILDNKNNKNEIFKGKSNNILDLLIGNEAKEDIKIEIYINKQGLRNNIACEFRIGLKGLSSNKLYVVKDINQLLISYYNKVPIKYGKDFTFNLKEQNLNYNEKRILGFLNKVKDIEGKSSNFTKRQDKYIDGKNLIIPEYLLLEFFNIISENRVYLDQGFFYRPVETEILMDKPNINIELKNFNKEYILSIDEGLPETLDKEGRILLYGSTIYLPNIKYCYDIEPFINLFKHNDKISFSMNDEYKVLAKLLPKLYTLSQNVYINKSIKNKIVKDDPIFMFYFDKINKDIVLTLKVKYGKYEFNIFSDIKEKIIYRDLLKEDKVLDLLRSLGFDSSKDKFYFLVGDDYIFKFFKDDINKLQDIGEVYYSENFKIIKNISNKNLIGEIKSNKYDYFELKFKVEDIALEEMKNIILALKDNLKFYKLKDGEFLDLENIELKNFLNMLDILSEDLNFESDVVKFNKNKSLYINNFLKENKMRYIKGKNELNKIQNKFKDISKLKFELPQSLKADLRPYQVEGYNWFKTIDDLGFGGILGDEMGLGKTLQAISFILSTIPSKTLIIAPTSLLYNWGNEFDKFAPNIRYRIINGNKEERELLIKDIDKYDVIITTYNLVKRDLEEYKSINFDYCFIDEAQFIKNSNSQNAFAVKSINSKRKFALTGTPVENSLMELWSIFDFVMPGYLFDEKRFNVRYHKRLNESPEVLEELNKLIKPFILRRYKKDVIKELPDKIEKKLIIPMSQEQEKIYSTYADYARKLIEKKVKDDDLKNSKIEVLSYITKLRQISLDPSVIIKDYIGDSGKIDALIELLIQGIDEGHKILVFSQFTSVLKNIRARLENEKIEYSYLDGSISSLKRIELVNNFNEDESNKVFLISLKAGGTGLNLTSADIVIHFDPWWNPAVEDQATDRAHRFGQDKVVEVIKLISKNTIEEKIVDLQEEKRKLIEKIIDNDLSIDITSLTEEDILSLFSLK
ncbi:DEAD/DEAH box helicase [Clostridium sp.]|uniref:DEAD/DEAH box helicase n=1 Tax=Clostridium sp. TaxID=1506 RepID=UPI002622D489|nr:DEAD/DEAH box helicase [Clostridium sp.]